MRGDARCGETVKHRSRVKPNPGQPNLQPGHVIRLEILAESCSDRVAYVGWQSWVAGYFSLEG